MTDHEHLTPSSLAIFTLAQIKANTEAFESGDANVFDTLDAVHAAIEAFRAATVDHGRRGAA